MWTGTPCPSEKLTSGMLIMIVFLCSVQYTELAIGGFIKVVTYIDTYDLEFYLKRYQRSF